MVSKDLIIDAGDSEVSLALLEDKQLIELNKEKRNIKFSVGDIYLGKVKKIMHEGIRENTHKPVSKSNPRRKVSDKQAVAISYSMAKKK